MTTSLENPCRPGRLAIALLALASAALACGGCGSVRTGPSYGSRAEMGTGTSGEPITVAELDELTRAFADRYVGLLSSTCDALKKDNPDPIQRREAQQLLLSCATNVYDIASNPDAFTRMLDLVVVTTLVSQVWIDDDRAGDVFGDRDEVLVRALHHGRVEAWALASQVLRPDQLDLLDYTMWDWRRHNPDMVRTPFVRFSNFAIGRGKSGNAEVLAAGGFFAIRQASQAVDEARLLTERMFYMLKREPTLLRWEAEALKDDLLATPGVGTYLSDVHRLTAQVEALPKNVATEREAILAAFDQRTKALDATLADVKAVVADANGLVTAVGDASLPLNEMLKTAGDVFANYDAWSRWSATQPGRAFDIREYTEGVKELAVAVGKMNDVLGSSSDLLGSSEWGRRVEQVNQSADGRMTIAFDRSQVVVNEVFRRVYVALAVLFGLLILYRWISFRLARRLKLLGTSDGVAHGGNGRSTSPAQTAPRAIERGVLP